MSAMPLVVKGVLLLYQGFEQTIILRRVWPDCVHDALKRTVSGVKKKKTDVMTDEIMSKLSRRHM